MSMMANEKRLIDANKYPCRNCGKTYCHQNCKEFIEWLENPVDAVEVVHSSWILNDDGSGTCKHCRRTTKSCWDFDSQMNYCPNCGADMRERNANETV